MFIAAQIALTIATLGYGLVTVLADLNKTHATNPTWVPHARFHVVWQIVSYVGVALTGLVLIWAGPIWFGAAALILAAVLGVCVFSAFFIAIATMRLYGGSLFDPNGYIPGEAHIGTKTVKVDKNVMTFSIASLVLVVGVVLALLA